MIRPPVPAVLVGIALCVFVAISVRSMWPRICDGQFSAPTPYHSTDRYLESVLGQDASAKLVAGLAKLPPGKPIIILSPAVNAQSAFISALVCYLGWPREIQGISVDAADASSEVAKIDPHAIAAIMFYNIPPPVWLPTVEAGRGLHIAVMEAK